MRKGLRIEISGTDGAGKTTGLKYLIGLAESEGLSVLETREVGSPHIPVCVKLRELVLSTDSNMGGEAMELIFSAMRLENDRFYKSVEDKYDLIVSDRGWFDHLAYTDHNVSESFTKSLYNDFVGNMTALPDIAIYFKVDPQTALKRRVRRGETMDAIEIKGVAFQDLVRKSFDKYIEEYQNKFKIYVVDANQDIEGVRTQLVDIFKEIKSAYR
jgi:dTMP kinase